MSIQKSEVIVLRTTKLRETSLIVTLFSRDFGKLQVLTKGVRQAGSPWAGLYEPLNRLEIVFYEKHRSDIHLATEAVGLDLRSALRKDFRALSHGYYLTEVLENFANPGEPDPAYWSLIEEAYEFLPTSPKLISLIFQLKLLHHAGFLPDLETIESGSGSKGLLSASFYETLKPRSGLETMALLEKKPVLQNASLIQDLRYLLKESWEKGLRLQMKERELEEGESLLGLLVAAKLDKKLRSRKFLEELDPA